MTALDRRITPARPDLAAAHLAGQVEAARFVEGTPMRVLEASAAVRRHPAPDAPLDTEALHGEAVTVYDMDDEGWAWGQLASDSLCGLDAGQRADRRRARADAPRVACCARSSIPAPPSSCRRWRPCRWAARCRSRA